MRFKRVKKGSVVTSIIIFLPILVFVFILTRYNQTSRLKAQGKKLLEEGHPQEAVLVYKKALALFPLRGDIAEDLEGTRLIIRSNLEYEKIYQIGTIQLPPPISYWRELRPGEIFVPILMYHHIRANPRPGDLVSEVLNVTQEQLESQLNYLTTHNYHAVSSDEIYKALNGQEILPENPVVLTFDDGYRDFYENAFPVLKKYKMKAMEFIITDVVDAAPYLTWAQIAEMDKSGLVEFGAHTRHHCNLPDIGREAIIDEIMGSKKNLQSHLKKPIKWFAYPYGSYGRGDFILNTVKQAGFVGAVSTIYGAIQSKDQPYLMPRIGVDGRFTLDNLAQRIKR